MNADRLIVAALLTGCAACSAGAAQENRAGLPEPSGPPIIEQARPDVPTTATVESAPKEARDVQGELHWRLDDGVLRLLTSERNLVMVIACRAEAGGLLAYVPSFTPIGSEDRFNLGLGNEPVTLVAGLTPRQGKSGVTATGATPNGFERLFTQAAQISANYGTQTLGPLPPPSAPMAAHFAKRCG